jgi:hypothetical protein
MGFGAVRAAIQKLAAHVTSYQEPRGPSLWRSTESGASFCSAPRRNRSTSQPAS